MTYKSDQIIPNSLIFKSMQNKRIAGNIPSFLFFSWEIGTKNLTKRKFIIEPNFFTSWTLTSEKCTRMHMQENKGIYLSIYISLYENLFENGYIYIYIYMHSFTKRLTFQKYIFYIYTFCFFFCFAQRNKRYIIYIYIYLKCQPFWKRVSIYTYIYIYIHTYIYIYLSGFHKRYLHKFQVCLRSIKSSWKSLVRV